MQPKTTKIRRTKRRSRTDWKRVDAMKDSDIDFSDIPELGADFFKNAILWQPREERNERQTDAHIPPRFREATTDVFKVKLPYKEKLDQPRKQKEKPK
jgi:hypothetical protein